MVEKYNSLVERTSNIDTCLEKYARLLSKETKNATGINSFEILGALLMERPGHVELIMGLSKVESFA